MPSSHDMPLKTLDPAHTGAVSKMLKAGNDRRKSCDFDVLKAHALQTSATVMFHKRGTWAARTAEVRGVQPARMHTAPVLHCPLAPHHIGTNSDLMPKHTPFQQIKATIRADPPKPCTNASHRHPTPLDPNVTQPLTTPP